MTSQSRIAPASARRGLFMRNASALGYALVGLVCVACGGTGGTNDPVDGGPVDGVDGGPRDGGWMRRDAAAFGDAGQPPPPPDPIDCESDPVAHFSGLVTRIGDPTPIVGARVC